MDDPEVQIIDKEDVILIEVDDDSDEDNNDRKIFLVDLPNTCEICGKTFKTVEYFRIHERLHKELRIGNDNKGDDNEEDSDLDIEEQEHDDLVRKDHEIDIDRDRGAKVGWHEWGGEVFKETTNSKDDVIKSKRKNVDEDQEVVDNGQQNVEKVESKKAKKEEQGKRNGIGRNAENNITVFDNVKVKVERVENCESFRWEHSSSSSNMDHDGVSKQPVLENKGEFSFKKFGIEKEDANNEKNPPSSSSIGCQASESIAIQTDFDSENENLGESISLASSTCSSKNDNASLSSSKSASIASNSGSSEKSEMTIQPRHQTFLSQTGNKNTKLVQGERTCNFCKKTFHSIEYYRIHQRVHMSEKMKSLSSDATPSKRKESLLCSINCGICSQSFPSYQLLAMHMQTHKKARALKHQKAKKDKFVHDCEICHIGFSNRNSYINHMNQHRKGYLKCSICLETFPTKESLKIHKQKTHWKKIEIATHIDEEGNKNESVMVRVRCKLCQEQLPAMTTEEFRVHVGLHFGELLQCATCKTVFYDDDKYITHTGKCQESDSSSTKNVPTKEVSYKMCTGR